MTAFSAESWIFVQSIDTMIGMHLTNMSSIDMNLLPVLDALLRECHVGRAAASVGRSQPAVSHALARLRALLGDPLLRQSGRRMVLTARAEALREPVGRLMRDARQLIAGKAFDPATSTRTFRLMMPDFVANFVVPSLIAQMALRAPGIRLQITEWRGERTLDRDFLDSIDLVLSTWTDRFPGFERELLLRDRDVLVARRGRRRAKALGSVEGFLASPHVAVVGPGERQDLVDAWLRTLGETRQIALTVPTYLLALGIVAETDLLAVVPDRLFRHLGVRFSVRSLPLPLDSGCDEIFLHHSKATDSDAGVRWLRGMVRRAAEGSTTPTP